MQTLGEIREMLARYGLSPRHALGQNFLIDHNLIRKLVDEARVSPGDVVLEVGPGTGTLTEELLARGASVVACEIDAGLCRLLRERFEREAREGRFELVEGDCLRGKRALAPGVVEAVSRRGGRFLLVSNLPYGAGTVVMATLLADVPACVRLAVTIQREVAQRLVARASTKDYGPLAILAQAASSVRVIAELPPACFWPRPEVTSAMVVMERLDRPRTPDLRGLFDFAQRVFEKRRKQLGAVLGRGVEWPAGVEATMRAESLSPQAVVELFERAPGFRDGGGRGTVGA